LRGILGWRCTALQTAAERLAEQLPRLVVERFSALFVPELFASDGFHPNARAHAMWGEEIAALALPLLRDRQPPCGHSVNSSTNMGHIAQSSKNNEKLRSMHRNNRAI
jgi:hypothetical protein